MSATTALEADIEIEASPEQVWTVVSDLARMGEWSPECRKVIVFGTPREGTHLVGFNRRRWVAWPTNSRIVRYEPGRAIGWKVFSNRSTWSYELEPINGGTRVIERRDMPPQGVAPVAGFFARVFLGGVESHDAELQKGMRATLDRIKSEVERLTSRPLPMRRRRLLLCAVAYGGDDPLGQGRRRDEDLAQSEPQSKCHVYPYRRHVVRQG